MQRVPRTLAHALALCAACGMASLGSVASAGPQVIPPGLPGDPNSAPRPPRRPPVPPRGTAGGQSAPRSPASPAQPGQGSGAGQPAPPPAPPVAPAATPLAPPPTPQAAPGPSPTPSAAPDAASKDQYSGTPQAPTSGAAPAAPGTPAAAGQAAPPPEERRISTRFRKPRPWSFPGAKVPFPAFKPDHWLNLQGTPIAAYEPGKLYAIEFFSTTCGHCKEAAPVVAELANVFGDEVVFFGVTDEPLETVKSWIEKPENSEKVHFPIVADPDREGNKAFQHGTFRISTPRIFIVKDGVLQWYGHPNGAQQPLDALIEGSWDPESIKNEYIIESSMERARDHLNKMRQEIERTGEWSNLYALLDSMKQALPERAAYFDLQKFGTLIGPDNKAEEGYALARQIVETYASDVASLRTVSRTILSSPWVQVRDLPFAHEVALKADALAEGKDSRSAEILALSWFSQGDREKALAEISRAIELESDPRLKARYTDTKNRYTTETPGPVPSAAAEKPKEHVDHDRPPEPPTESAPAPGGDVPTSAPADPAAAPK